MGKEEMGLHSAETIDKGESSGNTSLQGEAIRVDGLAKRFKGHGTAVQALKGVSFDVERGTIFCILGPNGAGKTTLLRILTTVMRPSSGTAWIEGFEIGRQNIQIRNLIGVVAQDNYFDRYLSVWQNLSLHAEMHGMPRSVYEPRIRELLRQVGLDERRGDFLDNFSGGMQRRVALIRALIHEPRILFLDEPTTGLDPAARREMWDTIQDLKRQTTVILTTHYMEEADRLSDRIMILNAGEVVMVGTPQALKQRISPPDTYELALNTMTADAYRDALAPYIHDARRIDADVLQFRLNRLEDLPAVMAAIQPRDLRSLGLAQADLETVYLSVAGDMASPSSASKAAQSDTGQPGVNQPQAAQTRANKETI
jgi:ABC-2 type transport system ATP-binding protein